MDKQRSPLLANNNELNQLLDLNQLTVGKNALTENKLFKAIFKNAGTAIGITNAKGVIIGVNQKSEDLLGYTASELKKLPPYSITHPDDADTTIKLLQRLANGEIDGYRVEKRWIRKDGQTIWVDLSTTSIKDEMGTTIATIGTATDITDRKHGQMKLKQQYKELRELNMTVTVLLKEQAEQKEHLEREIVDNIYNLLEPLVSKLKSTNSRANQKEIIGIIESNLNNLKQARDFAACKTLSELTPKEIRIANLIILGKTSKEIAYTLGISYRTVDSHRGRIRKKLGIKKNLKKNLQTVLSHRLLDLGNKL